MSVRHSLRIDFDAAGKLRLTLTSTAVVSGQAATVALPLCFDPDGAAPQMKVRAGESEAAYAARFAKTIPSQLDLDPELVAGLADLCARIVAAGAPVGAHYAARAALTHALAADGQVPEGVTHQIGLKAKLRARADSEQKKADG